MTPPLFELKAVSHGFQGGTQALDCLNLQVATGEFLGLLGCNGAGKSTLLYILGGDIFSSTGECAMAWSGDFSSIAKQRYIPAKRVSP